jgi:hypothetical protein
MTQIKISLSIKDNNFILIGDIILNNLENQQLSRYDLVEDLQFHAIVNAFPRLRSQREQLLNNKQEFFLSFNC